MKIPIWRRACAKAGIGGHIRRRKDMNDMTMWPEDLKRAKEMLDNGGYTCVLRKGEETRTSASHGVRPLLAWMHEGGYGGFFAAEQGVGQGTTCVRWKKQCSRSTIPMRLSARLKRRYRRCALRSSTDLASDR